MVCRVKNPRVLRVSSAAIKSTSRNTVKARRVISSRLPSGVATTYRMPGVSPRLFIGERFLFKTIPYLFITQNFGFGNLDLRNSIDLIINDRAKRYNKSAIRNPQSAFRNSQFPRACPFLFSCRDYSYARSKAFLTISIWGSSRLEMMATTSNRALASICLVVLR